MENNDLVFDDGVAPELALDFDAQHIDSSKALGMTAGAIGFLCSLYFVISLTDPPSQKPCINRKFDCVVEKPREGPPTKAEE